MSWFYLRRTGGGIFVEGHNGPLVHSESIPTKKNFRPKIFDLDIFLTCDPIFLKKVAIPSHDGEKFSKSRFLFWNTFWTILNRFRPKKIFDQKFLSVIFSTSEPIFRTNGYVKSYWENFFEIEIFVLKYVLDHSETISTKKIFRPKIFVFDIFLTCDPSFWKNGYLKSWWEKIFEIEIFVLKYVLVHSESIPTKKILTKIFFLCHFFDLWLHFSKKWLCQVIMGKNFRNRDFRFKMRCGPFLIDSDQKHIYMNIHYLSLS